MSDISVFSYKNYKTYLKAFLAAQAGAGHGQRSRWANVMKCHTTYISQILNKEANCSLEQALRLSQHLQHNDIERRYFLLLVQLAQAGSNDLKKIFEIEINAIQEQRAKVSSRVDAVDALRKRDEYVYYSAWYYGAVHVCVSLPGMTTSKAIGRYFGLPIEATERILSDLLSMGLISRTSDGFKIEAKAIHLGQDSENIVRHHTNWRLQSIASLAHSRTSDLHYSSVITIARQDLQKIRAILLDAIEKARVVVRSSKDELICFYGVDLFQLEGKKN